MDYISGIAKAAWAPRMETLHITARHISTVGFYEVGEEKWLAFKEGNNLKTIRDISCTAEKQLFRWSRALGHPVLQYEDPMEQGSYLRYLEKNMERLGRLALARVDSKIGAPERLHLTRQSKH